MTDEDKELQRVEGAQFIQALVSAEEAKRLWAEYQELTKAILDLEDYQQIGPRAYKKKSAWRKYMRFYGLGEDESKTRIEVTRDENGLVRFAAVYSVIVSKDGRSWTG